LFSRARAPFLVLTTAYVRTVHAPFDGAHHFRLFCTGLVQAARHTKEKTDMNNFFNDLQGKINQAMESSPAKDIERNVKAMMTQGFSKLDLVTREEFDIQAQVLAKTRAKLEALELRVAELEARLAAQPATATATAAASPTATSTTTGAGTATAP
jgi:BMFP domain-containing protein YqiC